MCKSFISVLLILISTSCFAISKKWIFYIDRNKNKNRVQYGVKINDDCTPAKKKPIYQFWRMLEKGPNVTESVGWLERRAYGIDIQNIRGNRITMRLKAMPTRLVTIETSKNKDKCVATAYVSINKKRSQLRYIYVFAEKGFIKPTVKHIDLFGKSLKGSSVTERIKVD